MSPPPRTRHLVAVINSLAGGGAERVLCTLLAEWVQAPGWKLTLVLLDDLPRRYAVPSGVEVHVLDARESLTRSIFGLARTLPRLRPDVILSFLTRANLAAIAVAVPMGQPVVVSERVNTLSHFADAGWRGRVSRALVRLVYPRATRVLAVSTGVARALQEHFGVPARRLAVVENPYDLAQLRHSASQPPALSLPGPYVVAVGRLTANKNHALLLQAIAMLDDELHLVILGEGEEREALLARAIALGVDRRVHFPGHLANPHAIVGRALAYVSASNAEGFPNAAAEAMVQGVPVVMTDCPSGPAELLGRDEGSAVAAGTAPHGWLVPMNDADALVAALREVLSGRFTADRTRSARLRMEAFGAGPIARRYLQLLDDACPAQCPTYEPPG